MLRREFGSSGRAASSSNYRAISPDPEGNFNTCEILNNRDLLLILLFFLICSTYEANLVLTYLLFIEYQHPPSHDRKHIDLLLVMVLLYILPYLSLKVVCTTGFAFQET